MEKFDEEFEEIQFKSLDQNQMGKIDYYEFLKHETGKLLIKRDKVSYIYYSAELYCYMPGLAVKF